MVSEDELDRQKREKIVQKAHTKDILGMEPAIKSTTEIDSSGPWSQQKTFKDAIQQLKDFKAGLFLLDKVEKIDCSEEMRGLDKYDRWDKCTVHFRNRTQEFFDINTILTDEHSVKNILSTEGKFRINFKEPTQVELYTWKGSLIDLHPHEIKRVVVDKSVTPQHRKKVAYRTRFTNLAKKGKISDTL